jgi:regulation of enolase protein 1 (concanavalin A-like superfamily)
VWRVVSRTFATDVDPNLVAASPTWSFTTPSTGGPLPTGWSTQDVGSTGLAGSATFSSGVFTVSGAGSDIWGTADAFRFVYQQLSGDGQIVARVASQQNTHPFAKAGIMIRQSLNANSAHVILDTVPNPATEFMTRAATGGQTTFIAGASTGAPRFLRLSRSGTTITGATSSNGTTWTNIGSATLPTGTVFVGLIVSSVNTSRLNTSTFDSVSVSGGTAPPPPTLPAPWETNDVGSVGLEGSASASNGVFTVSGSGADIWGTADGFRYAYQPLPGDGEIVARVTAVQNTSSFAKAGVMIRQSLQAGSPHVILDSRPNSAGIELMTRAAANGQTSYLGGSSLGTPVWLRLSRSGGTVTAAVSSNGTAWTTSGSAPLPTGNALVGLVVSSVNNSQLNTSTFDNVTATIGSAPPPPPPAPNIVVYATDVPAAGLHGGWTKVADASAAAGIKLSTPNIGESHTDAPLATPGTYFDATFSAPANTPYTIWLRLQALNNDKLNDAVWVQFSDARVGGAPIYGLDTTSGLLVNLATSSSATSLDHWGWQNAAYWLSQPVTVSFASAGTHTIRVQIREDGVQLDQIVLSPSQYFSSAPGSVTNDGTIVPKP